MILSEIEYGEKGTHVEVLQMALRMMQCLGTKNQPIEVDGEVGENTVFAIKEFQKRQKAYGCTCCKIGCCKEGVWYTHCWERLLGVDCSG